MDHQKFNNFPSTLHDYEGGTYSLARSVGKQLFPKPTSVLIHSLNHICSGWRSLHPSCFDWPQGWCAWPPATFRVGNPRLENLELLNSSAQHCHLSNQIRTVNDMYSLVWHLHIIYTNKAILSRCKFIILWCVPMKFDFVLFCLAFTQSYQQHLHKNGLPVW